MPSGELDRLLDPSYLGDLRARPIEEIRTMRAECQRVEAGLSYLRRLVQGRLDIVAAELGRRVEGLEPSDPASLVDQLPEILGHNVQAPGLGRLPSNLEPPEDPELTAELDGILHAQSLTGLGEVDDDELRLLADRLTDYEHTVSGQRRALFDHIDALQADLTRRYKTGEASVESLLP